MVKRYIVTSSGHFTEITPEAWALDLYKIHERFIPETDYAALEDVLKTVHEDLVALEAENKRLESRVRTLEGRVDDARETDYSRSLS